MRRLAAAVLVILATTCANKEPQPPVLDRGGNTGGGGGGGGGSEAGADAGALAVLASAQPNPRGVAVGAAYVYFACAGDGTAGAITAKTGRVRRVPKLGGAVEDLATGLDGPYALGLSAGEVVFTTPDPTSLLSGSILAVPSTPGGSTRTVTASIDAPAALALDATNAYVATAIGTSGVWVRRAPLAGGSATDVTQVMGTVLPTALTLAQGYAYFVAQGAVSALYRAPTSTGVAEVLAQANGVWSDLLVLNDRVWIADASAAGSIMTVPIAGGAATTVVSSLDHPTHLATDGTWVYFTTYASAGSIGAVRVSDGTTVTIASGLSYPLSIAVDDAVYAGVSDGVVRVARP